VVQVYNPENPLGLISSPRVWLLAPEEPPRLVNLTGKAASFGLIVKIKHVTNREAAQALKGRELAVARDDLEPLAEDEFYQSDLLNLDAFLETGQRLGRVVNFLATGASLVLVIEDEAGWENLVPFTEELVPEVDLAAGRLTVLNAPGLIQPKSP
jgi:16S rRNA processing protein RimM